MTEIDRFKTLEKKKIPDNFDFSQVHSLSNELKEKLNAVKPRFKHSMKQSTI
jgi:tRNA uridine 5-carboxymethylaminomethyl modification enzyme